MGVERESFYSSKLTATSCMQQLSDIVDVVGLTPVPSPQPSSEPPEEDGIRCVCGSEEDDGFTIQCDNCLVWQHALCVGIARNNVPDVYLCDECRPDVVDVEAGVKRKRTRESSLATPVNEISENILAAEAVEFMKSYAKQLGEARRRMPRIPPDEPLGQVNFELAQVVVFPSVEDLRVATKTVDVRELRVRSLGRRSGVARLGVFAGEDIDPGAFIGEFVGHVQPISILTRKGSVERVGQSHVLFCRATPELVVDARRFGNSLRSVRRSCRANCEAKLVLTEAETFESSTSSSMTSASAVHWCLFARNTIREGEELFLPFDYVDGNTFFRYECCCAYPELCLADDMAPMVRPSDSESVGPTPSTNPSTAVAAASSTNVSITSSRAASVDSMATAGRKQSDRKLSREERKLQQYIEFIERMESAEKRQHRKSGASSAGANSPPSPSPRKNSSKSSSSKASPSGKTEIKPDPGASLGSPLVSPSGSPDKRPLPLKKMLSRNLARASSISDLPSTQSKVVTGIVKEDPNVQVIKADSITATEDVDVDADVDVESMSTGTSTTNGTSAPDTPSKRKVSLSDYLSRRKSSPADQQREREASDTGRLQEGLVDAHSVDPTTIESTLMTQAASGQSAVHSPMSMSASNPTIPSPAVRYSTPPPPAGLEKRSYEQSPREYDRWRREDERRDSHPQARRYPLFTDGGRERGPERESTDRGVRDHREQREYPRDYQRDYPREYHQRDPREHRSHDRNRAHDPNRPRDPNRSDNRDPRDGPYNQDRYQHDQSRRT